MGDLYALVESRARPGDHVAIVDGLFEQVPAVWHKEILFALSRGVHVYGASSMGALRASELHPFGMVGVGRIFEQYRDGLLTDDDEVVVAHATAEQHHRPLSTAMVSLRACLESLAARGLMSPELAASLARQAKALHYPQRGWGALLDLAREAKAPATALDAIRAASRERDAKAQDALALLRHLKLRAAAPPEPFEANFVLEQTAFWRGLTHSQASRVAEAHAEAAAIVADPDASAHLRAAAPEREAVVQFALLAAIARGNGSGARADANERRAAMLGVMARHGLSDIASLQEWRARERLDAAAWSRLLEAEAAVARLWRDSSGQLDADIVTAMQRHGIYDLILQRREAGRTRLERFGPAMPLAEMGITLDDIQRWYETRIGPMVPDPETHARHLGFPTLRDFIDEVLIAYLGAQEEPFDMLARPAGAEFNP